MAKIKRTKNIVDYINNTTKITKRTSKKIVKYHNYSLSPKSFMKKQLNILSRTKNIKNQTRNLAKLYEKAYFNLMKKNMGLNAVGGLLQKQQDAILKLANDYVLKHPNIRLNKLDLRFTKNPLIKKIREHGTLLSLLTAINMRGDVKIRYNNRVLNKNGVILEVFSLIKNGEESLIYLSENNMYSELTDILEQQNGEIRVI